MFIRITCQNRFTKDHRVFSEFLISLKTISYDTEIVDCERRRN